MCLMEDCIFCKIVAGKIPCQKVYEDDLFLGFLDIKPLTTGHVLLIPKTHYQWTYDVPNFGQYFEIGKVVANSQLKNLNCNFVTFLTVGRQVPHAHLHIIPRYQDDPHKEGIDATKRQNPTTDELRKIAAKIKL